MRARQLLWAILDRNWFLQHEQGDLTAIKAQVERDAMALAWMALQLVYTGRIEEVPDSRE